MNGLVKKYIDIYSQNSEVEYGDEAFAMGFLVFMAIQSGDKMNSFMDALDEELNNNLLSENVTESIRSRMDSIRKSIKISKDAFISSAFISDGLGEIKKLISTVVGEIYKSFNDIDIILTITSKIEVLSEECKEIREFHEALDYIIDNYKTLGKGGLR